MRKAKLALGFGAGMMVLTACEPGTVSYGGSVYYDSLLWNDYYYGRPRPPEPDRPDRPVRPEPPIAKPPVARPPIHRPPTTPRPLPARPRPV